MLNALIIDDDPIQLRIAELMLKKSDAFNSTSYLNAGHALDYLKKNQQNASSLPDVIFIDLNMPKLDGWGFLNIYEDLLRISLLTIIYLLLSFLIRLTSSKR